MSIQSCGLGHDGVVRAFYSPREVEVLLGISHAKLYRLIDSGRLDARKIDRKTVITVESIRHFIETLPRVSKETVAAE